MPDLSTLALQNIALALLDEEIGKSELLMSVAPIRLVSAGGLLAVRLCYNREFTWDIDCLLDPSVAALDEYREEFAAVARAVSRSGGYGRNWLNQQIQLFVARERRMDLFLESVDQGVAVYEGTNLIIYAGRLDWALERKVRRVAHVPDRRRYKDVDLPDAAALIRTMRKADDPPLSFEYIRGLNFNGFDVAPTEASIQAVAGHYLQTYGEIGLVEMVWDEKAKRYKYQGHGNEWVWV